MKKKLIIISIFCYAFSSLFAQETKYIIVPLKMYKHNKVDIYGLSSLTNQLFAKAGYKVFTNNRMSWPADLQADPCKALYTETEDVSPLIGLTKVKLTLRDCFQKVHYETVGKDNDIDDIKALHTALEEAFENMQKEIHLDELFATLPKTKSVVEPTKEILKKEQKPLTMQKQTTTKKAPISLTFEETLKAYWRHNVPVGIEGIYEADQKQYFIREKDNVFMLYNNTEQQLAQLEKTTLGDIYKVRWDNGTESVAFLKDRILKIEKKQEEKVKVIALKKVFPNE